MAFGISVIPGNPFLAFNLSSKEPLGTCLPDEIIVSYSSFDIHLPTLVVPIPPLLSPLRLPFSPQQPYPFHRTSGRIKSIWMPQRTKQNYADGLKILHCHKSNRMSLNNGSLLSMLKIQLTLWWCFVLQCKVAFSLLLQLADLR